MPCQSKALTQTIKMQFYKMKKMTNLKIQGNVFLNTTENYCIRIYNFQDRLKPRTLKIIKNKAPVKIDIANAGYKKGCLKYIT